MSSNSLLASIRAFSSTSAYTTDKPALVVDVISETRMFWATRSSILRVTSCSTRSALWPGHGVTTATCRTGMSGSLRFVIAAYAHTPHASTPMSRTHETGRGSTQVRATLRCFGTGLFNRSHDVTRPKKIRPRADDSLSRHQAAQHRYLVADERPRTDVNRLDHRVS